MAFEWKNLVRSVAPTIAQALGGPLAGMAVQAVSDAVLGKPDGTDEEIASALSTANPETLLSLKKADQDFKVKMKELDIDLERLAYEDVKDARAREIAIKDKMPAVLAIMLLIMFGGVMVALFCVPIPTENEATIYTMIGTLGTLMIAACAYYHGTTKASSMKNAALFQAAAGNKKG